MDIPIDANTVVAIRSIIGIVGRASYSGRSKTMQSTAEAALKELQKKMKDPEVRKEVRRFHEKAVAAKCWLAEQAKGPDPKMVERQKAIMAVIEQIGKERQEWLDDPQRDSNAYFESEKQLLAKLDEFNDLAIDEDIPLGRIHTEGRGDGYAIYVCVGGNHKGELCMWHVHAGDAWTSPMIEKAGGYVDPKLLDLQRHSRDNLFGKS